MLRRVPRRRWFVAIAALGLLALAALLWATLMREGEREDKPSTTSSERVAFDGTNYFVVWEDDHGRMGEGDVYGARISSAGSVLDRPPIRISTARESQVDPQVAFDGRNFLVVWSDDRLKPDPDDPQDDVFGARVTRAGVVLDPDGIPISTAEGQEYDPSLAFDGSRFLVVWTASGSGFGDIYGARIATTGKVLDPKGFVISSGSKGRSDPAVAFDGTRYLIAWSEEAPDAYDIFAARVSPAGKTLDPKAIRISRGGHAWEAPTVAFGDENYLVAWTDWETGYYQEIRGTRVSPDGTVLDPGGLVIARSENDNSGQLVAFDGSNYLVVWSGTPEEEVEGDFTSTGGVYSARVSTDGVVLDSDGRAISTAPDDQAPHGIAFDGANHFVTWWRWAARSTFADDEYDIHGVRLTSEGTTIDKPPMTISTGEPR
jgi:hypothetical protein